MTRETAKISLGNINGNEEKDRVKDVKDIGTVEKNGKIEGMVSEDQMETVKNTALFHQFHKCSFSFLGEQKTEDLKRHL